MPTRSYTFWSNHDVLGGPAWWTWESKALHIKDFVSVRLKGSVWIVGPVTAQIKVNDYTVWEQFELIQSQYPVDVDVSMYIYEQSDNVFSIGVGPLGGATFTLTGIVEYTHEPPGPPFDFWKWLQQNWWIPAIAVGGLAVMAVVIPAIKRERRVYVVKP